jgi:NADPH-dependent 2,4-dienoyl-CoA reductase/sulfur reductase-like enzyme
METARALRPDETLVVVGASLAGLRAVEAARQHGFDGRIILLGEEPHLPYDRPPLSKAFLTGHLEDSTFRGHSSLSTELKVELLLDTAATALDVTGRQVITSNGPIGYDRLVIATGSSPRRIPDLPSLAGVHLLRTKDHAAAIRASVRPGCRVVVLGGGFIGAEVASACRSLGAAVSIVEAADVPLVRAVGSEMGAVLAGLHERHGVSLRSGTTLTGLHGGDRLTAIGLSDGSVLPTDLLVLGVGARPATEWLHGCDVELDERDGGIACDQYLATSAAGVWAAGDVARWENVALGQRMRLENWTSASQQGAHAGRSAVTGELTPFGTIPYYWTDWYGQRIQFVGLSDADETRCFGDLDGGRLLTLYRSGRRVAGALAVNQPGRIMKVRALIAAGTSWEDALAFVGRTANPGPELGAQDKRRRDVVEPVR